MINVNRHTLANGLRIVHHEDKSTQMTALNILYDVGARDEDPDHTGFAHLFEHLMFGGSVNIPDYDTPVQNAGGENNAWTNNDITNYYITLPYQNVETGFWLESDRMLSLDFSPRSLEVQRQVVIEEFKQRNLNQPYGDASHLIREMAYLTHPYRWPTIGKEISHIANATLEEVKDFSVSMHRIMPYSPSPDTFLLKKPSDWLKNGSDQFHVGMFLSGICLRNSHRQPSAGKASNAPFRLIRYIWHFISATVIIRNITRTT